MVLFTQEIADLRLDGLLTLIEMTYGRLGDLFVMLRYPEQLQGPKRELDAQTETAFYRKLKDWRTLLLQYLLQKNRSLTGEDKPVSRKSGVKILWGNAPVDRLSPKKTDRSNRSNLRIERSCDCAVWAYSVARVPRHTSGGVQTPSSVC